MRLGARDLNGAAYSIENKQVTSNLGFGWKPAGAWGIRLDAAWLRWW
jgi:hypothetical protein